MDQQLPSHTATNKAKLCAQDLMSMHGDSRGQIFNSESLQECNSKKQINMEGSAAIDYTLEATKIHYNKTYWFW
jgi:hypothetical protein